MTYLELQCRNCNATFEHKTGSETIAYCPFCGMKVRIREYNIIHDYTIEEQDKYNEVEIKRAEGEIRRAEADIKIAEAEAKKAEAATRKAMAYAEKAENDRIFEFKRLEIEERRRKRRIIASIILGFIESVKYLEVAKNAPGLNRSERASLIMDAVYTAYVYVSLSGEDL